MNGRGFSPEYKTNASGQAITVLIKIYFFKIKLQSNRSHLNALKGRIVSGLGEGKGRSG